MTVRKSRLAIASACKGGRTFVRYGDDLISTRHHAETFFDDALEVGDALFV